MDAVVSLLDEDHTQRVEKLQGELEQRFGVKRVRQLVPYPHITYHGAQRYDGSRLRSILLPS